MTGASGRPLFFRPVSDPMPHRPVIAWLGMLLGLLTGVAVLAAPPAAKKAHAKRPAAAAPAPVTHSPPAAVTVVAAPPADPNLALLDTVSGMAAAGAPQLALKLADREQPDFAKDALAWMSWERERLYIYQSSKDWHAVIARGKVLPADAPAAFAAWEATQIADAWLHLGNGAEVRKLLVPLMWNGDAAPDDASLAALRQLLIRGYLADHKLDDAQAAVLRYRQDYPKDSGNWPVLEARLFLRTDQPQAALDVLQDIKGPEADMLALLASLRAGELEASDVLAQAVKLGIESNAPDDERVHAWVIAAEAAGDLKNPVARISAIQNGLGLEAGTVESDDIFALSPDMLWDAYLAYGQDLGNQLQLVVGDDQAWFVAASNRFDSSPIDACALFTVVAHATRDPKQADVAQWQFAELIQKQKGGGVVLRHLYLDSSRFKDPLDVPANVRYLLADDVLAIPDIPLASRLMQGLDAPPPDTDAAAWQLQRARVFVLGGNPVAGVDALNSMFADAKLKIDPDEVLQVLFDLQTLGRDRDALPFFDKLLAMDLQPEQRRQMYYWMADSHKALGEYPQAAELYLRSAMLPDPFSMDPWAQTARYQAAQMLAKAGMVEDARNLYRGLLNATKDPSRQAVLERDLQQLMLMPEKPTAAAP